MSGRTQANRPCDDDYAALEEVYSRLLEKHGAATLDDAIAFMQYAAVSQLNRNFVSFVRDYQIANGMV